MRSVPDGRTSHAVAIDPEEDALKVDTGDVDNAALRAREQPCAVHLGVERGQTPVKSDTETAVTRAIAMTATQVSKFMNRDAGKYQREGAGQRRGSKTLKPMTPQFRGNEAITGKKECDEDDRHERREQSTRRVQDGSKYLGAEQSQAQMQRATRGLTLAGMKENGGYLLAQHPLDFVRAEWFAEAR